jgi:hypothetical protein
MRPDETRVAIYNAQGGRCAECGKRLAFSSFQLAHRIPQRKWCIRKWGKTVIHHPLNMAAVCSLRCNAAIQINPDSQYAVDLAVYITERIIFEASRREAMCT